MRLPTALLALILAVAAIALPACSSGEAYRRGTVLSDADVDMLWDRAQLVLQSQGYLIDERASRRSELEMATQWQTQLVPTRYKGRRRMVKVRFVALDGGRYQTEVLVIQERNTEISEPLNIVAADWEDERTELVAQREDVILYRIESFFVRPELE